MSDKLDIIYIFAINLEHIYADCTELKNIFKQSLLRECCYNDFYLNGYISNNHPSTNIIVHGIEAKEDDYLLFNGDGDVTLMNKYKVFDVYVICVFDVHIRSIVTREKYNRLERERRIENKKRKKYALTPAQILASIKPR